MVSDSAIYTEALLQKQNGFPFWLTEPHNNLPCDYCVNGVQIGDILILTPDGGYDFIFNVFLDREHPINVGRTPPDFEPLPLDLTSNVLRRNDWQNAGTHISNAKASKLSVNGGASAVIPGIPTEFGGGFEFSSSNSSGGILVLPEGAARVDFKSHPRLRKYIDESIDSWFQHVNGEKFDRDTNNLYIVTGCDKSTESAVASFSGDLDGQAVSLKFTAASIDMGASYVWSTQSSAAMRVTPVTFSGGQKNQNHCIFVRGFTYTRRLRSARRGVQIKVSDLSTSRPWKSTDIKTSGWKSWWSSRTSRTSSSSNSSPKSSSSSASMSSDSHATGWEYSTISDTFESMGIGMSPLHRNSDDESEFGNYDFRCPRNPSEIINEYLLMVDEDADYIATHDEDWCSLEFEDSMQLLDQGVLLDAVTSRLEYAATSKATAWRVSGIPETLDLAKFQNPSNIKISRQHTSPDSDYKRSSRSSLSPTNSSRSTKSPHEERSSTLACHFCRRRKIACSVAEPGNPDRTCNQCRRRSLKCEYPPESRRGMRRRKPNAEDALASGGTKTALESLKKRVANTNNHLKHPSIASVSSGSITSPSPTGSEPSAPSTRPHSQPPSNAPGVKSDRKFFGLTKITAPVETSQTTPNTSLSATSNHLSLHSTIAKFVSTPASPAGRARSTAGDSVTSLNNKYNIRQKVAIGKDTISVVRLAHKWDRSEESLYAIKEFRKRRKNETEEEYVKKLTAEFCISSTLHHVNIVGTVDLVQDENLRWCEVTEFCPGGDLYAAIKKGGMSPSEVECCFKQILTGVDYLHSQGVAHRDIQPENLFFDTQGRLKIGDYGASTVYRLPWETTIHMSTGLCGSEPYIAPEQFLGKPYDARLVDIWACGIVYYCLHFQELPWRAAQLTDTLYMAYANACASPQPAQSSYPPTINNLSPRACRPLIRKMLEPDPKIRATIEEVIKHSWIDSIEVCHAVEDPKHLHVHACAQAQLKELRDRLHSS